MKIPHFPTDVQAQSVPTHAPGPRRVDHPSWHSGPPLSPCPTCGRSTAPFDVRRNALLETLTLLVDIVSEAHDADARQLLLAIAHDAKDLAEDLAL
jgi:hypothetical protein